MAVLKFPVKIFVNKKGSRKATVWILLNLVAALSLADHAVSADSGDPALTVMILHTAIGNGEISPCG